MKSNYEFRKSALTSLKGHWGEAVILSLIVLILSSLSSAVDYLTLDTTDLTIIQGINGIYGVFILLPALFGMMVVFLRLIRDPETNLLRSFFSNVTYNYGRAICSMLILFIIVTCFAVAGVIVSTAVASIPFSLLDVKFNMNSLSDIHSRYGLLRIFNNFNLMMYALTSAVLCLLTLIPMFMYVYSVALFPFIIEDNPNIGIREAYQFSKNLTKGHRMQLFLLDLSFIGWYFLCILTLGIGILWVMPYQQASRAQFYNELKNDFRKSQYLTIE